MARLSPQKTRRDIRKQPSDTTQQREAASERIPQSLSPMLAMPTDSLPQGDGWGYEFKWDGIRALAYLSQGELRLVSRRGNTLTRQFPELAVLAEAGLPTPLILDGEIVVMHGERVDFGSLQPRLGLRSPSRIERLSRSNPAEYVIFDLLWSHDGRCMDQPLRRRRAMLDALPLELPHISRSPITSVDTSSVINIAREHGLEGVIAKRWDSRYECDSRSGAWMKYRIVTAQEFVVGGWRESTAGSKEVGSLAVGYHTTDNNDLAFAGFVGSGFDADDHRRLRTLLQRRAQETNPFAAPLPRDDVHFVQPDLVVHVRFAQWTSQNILRHASYQGLRVDKPANEVIRET